MNIRFSCYHKRNTRFVKNFAKHLVKCEYTVKAARHDLDMFLHTQRVETVCQLILRKSPIHINIDVDVDETLQDKRGQATYEHIKICVLEHSGLNVNHLYIAQVKRKCGIIERENYNKPKSDNSRQPQCPPEKEDAIKEALRHFGMIE